VGHDRGGVAVDEDRPDTFSAERPTRLGAGVVELGRLADDDRSRADDQDGRGTGHAGWSAATKRSNTASASSGPGAPSGWYWTVSIGSSAWRRPSTDPSFRLTW